MLSTRKTHKAIANNTPPAVAPSQPNEVPRSRNVNSRSQPRDAPQPRDVPLFRDVPTLKSKDEILAMTNEEKVAWLKTKYQPNNVQI